MGSRLRDLDGRVVECLRKGYLSDSVRALSVAIAIFGSAFTLTPPALAAPPSHGRAPSLDVTGLNHACGVAVDSKGDLYAASPGSGEVKVYDPSHAELTSIANANEPCGLAVDSKGILYVSEKSTGKVVSYKPNIYPFSGIPTYEGPTAVDSSGNAKGIAVDRTDDRLYVAEGNHVAIYKSGGSFEANVGEGNLTNATGVAAYTYIYIGSVPSNLKRHSYLFVADASSDQVKTFAAKEGSPLKLRHTISGVDQDENPETANQEFGFGSAGAYLAADPGNESRETRKCAQVQVEGKDQACTQGHFFLYDAKNEVVDEFDATGEFVDQIANAAFADAEPTALALERSGLASDGTLYVSIGSSSGAKLLAYRPLGLPTRAPLPALSRVLTKARGVATDCKGYVYVAAEARIRVYSPAGTELTSFEDPEGPVDLATDCKGNVYVVEVPSSSEANLTYYAPAKYPPEAATSYTPAPPLISGEEGKGMQSVAINPANEHAFVVGGGLFSPIIEEFSPPSEGSALEGECGTGLGVIHANPDIDVYGRTGEVYVAANPQSIATVRCGAEPELLIRQIKGGGCPNGEFGGSPAIALDQSNGHIAEYSNNQPGGAAREYDSSGSCVAEFGTFSTNNGGYRLAVDNSCALHKPPLTEQTTPKCAATYPSDGTVYVASDGLENVSQPYDVSAFGGLEYSCLGTCGSVEFELKVHKAGTGTGKVTGPGIECGEDCTEKYPEGTTVTLTSNAAAGSEFTGWSGACSGTASCKVTMSEAKDVTATFDEEAKEPGIPLTVVVEGSGTVTSDKGAIGCKPFCTDEYEAGTKVTLTATATSGSIFYSWKGCDSGGVNGRQCTVTMDKAKTVKAAFITTHALEVSKAPGSGLGKVQSSPGGILCLANCSETTTAFREATKVTLKQTPAKHFHFVEWLGDCSGSGACEVTMGEDHAVEAKFAEDAKRLLTLTKQGGGQGTVKSSVAGINCGVTCSTMSSAYYQGEVVELTATPGKGSAFGGWSGACSGAGTCTVTMSEAKGVVAAFD